MIRKIIIYLLLMLFIHSTTVYAHKMMIDPVSEGSIKVVYEDGSFSTRTVVYVYDIDGNEIDHGRLNSEGYFFYNEETAHSFVADDGLGHRTEWTKGEEIVIKSDPHRWIMTGVVVIILVGIAVFFSYRSKKKVHSRQYKKRLGHNKSVQRRNEQ